MSPSPTANAIGIGIMFQISNIKREMRDIDWTDTRAMDCIMARQLLAAMLIAVDGVTPREAIVETLEIFDGQDPLPHMPEKLKRDVDAHRRRN